MGRLQDKYKSELAGALGEELGIKNVMDVPKLEKIVISMGVGKCLSDKKMLPAAAADLATITGQKAVICKARKSVSNFKLRKGYEIGAKVTLRQRRMYEFMDRLVNVAIPRMRDFRGLDTKSLDGGGNFSMGVSDQTIFPEIDLDKAVYRQGMNITFVTSAANDAHALRLLTVLGMPFKRSQESG